MATSPQRLRHVHRRTAVPSDRQVKSTVVSRLRENPYTEDATIAVVVHDGVVRLVGHAPSPLAKRAATEGAQAVPGVVEVDNELLIAA